MEEIRDYKCCVCGGIILSEEDLTICENCNNIYHKICWQNVKEECNYCKNKQIKGSNNKSFK